MSERFLAEVVREVRASIADGEYKLEPPDSPRLLPPSLVAAVERAPGGRGLIVEYKRRSPGRADPPPPPRSVREFADRTDVAGVVGYSCLATVPRFDGAPRLVRELAGSTSRPVLFKDFVVGRSQIEAARRAGASAVLLIARLEPAGLLDAPLSELAVQAHEAHLEVLLELHDRDDLEALGGVPSDLVGVNVRDLDTLSLDWAVAAETLAAARQRWRGPLVGLSGVDRPVDAERFWQAGCSAIVVGSAVARSTDPAAFLRSLLLSNGSVP